MAQIPNLEDPACFLQVVGCVVWEPGKKKLEFDRHLLNVSLVCARNEGTVHEPIMIRAQ